jgi:hypothetical protein
MAVGSAAVLLLGLGLAGPDAVVARGNVARFEQSGGRDVDLAYLRRLSADAVPALARLPEPQRTCVLRDRARDEDPWFAANLARSRARGVLRSLEDAPAPPPGTCVALTGS